MLQMLFRQINRVEPPPPWGLLTALFLFVAAFGLMFAGVNIGAVMVSDNVTVALTFGWLIGCMFVIAMIGVFQRSTEDRAALRLAPTPAPLITLFGVGFGVAVTLDLIGIPVQGRVLPPPELATYSAVTGGITWIMGAILMIIVQPLADEMLFRGILYPALRAIQSVWAAIILSSVFYGLFHQFIYASRDIEPWTALVEPLFMGLTCGIVRAATQSTRAAIVTHIGFGVFAVLKTLLIVNIGV